MDKTELMEQCERWHHENQHGRIITALEGLGADGRDAHVDSILARAYNNSSQYGKAVELLKKHEQTMSPDHMWNYRLGYALYYLGRYEEALDCFNRALEASPGDKDTLLFIQFCQSSLEHAHDADDAADYDADAAGADDDDEFEDVDSLRDLSRPAIRLRFCGNAPESTGASRFGGRPDVPPDFVWPEYDGTDYRDEKAVRPLSFLAQFNCADLAPYDSEHLLPDHGVLSFFYEVLSMTWGFSPEDMGSARVYWFEDASVLRPADFPENMDKDCRFPQIGVQFEPLTTCPDSVDYVAVTNAARNHEISSFQPMSVHERCKVFSESFTRARDKIMGLNSENFEPHSWLLGWPEVIQNSMFYKCELVTAGYETGRAPELIPSETRKAAELTAHEKWTLLMQMDTVESDDFELMWGDCGHIYFFIPREDLAARNFDNCWLILQCC